LLKVYDDMLLEVGLVLGLGSDLVSRIVRGRMEHARNAMLQACFPYHFII